VVTRTLRESIRRFGGLSTRNTPLQIARGESPQLINVEFSDRDFGKRGGFDRVHQNVLRNASARFDGVNDYIQIRHQTAYAASTGIYIGIGSVIRNRATTYAIVNKGHSATAADQMVKIVFNPTAGTGSLGAWVATIYDVGAATTRTLTLDDGDGFAAPKDTYRFLELYLSSATQYTFRMWSDAGAVISTTTASWTSAGAHVSDTGDFTIGVGKTAASTIGSDYADATLCEFRYYTGSVANIANRLCTTTNGWATKEIEDGNVSLFTGYWKLNDGTATGFVTDSTATANHGRIINNGFGWVTGSQASGTSALKLNGGAGWVMLRDLATTSVMSTVFSGAAARWTVRGLLTPMVEVNESTVRNGAALWAGGHATTPAPISVRVVSNKLQMKYNDGASVLTFDFDGTTAQDLSLASVANRQIRWAIWRYGAAGNGSINCAITYYDGSAYQIKMGTAQACGSAGPNNISRYISMGRHVATAAATDAFVIPYAFQTDGSVFGVIDDVQIYSTSVLSALGYLGLGALNAAAFQQQDLSSGIHTLRMWLKFDEGAGNILNVEGNGAAGTTTWRARVFPEADDGLRWDLGLVDPYTPPVTYGQFAFDRILTDGSQKRSMIALSGSTGYEIDVTAGTATAVFAGFFQGGPITAAQYGQRLILAARNGKRPMVWDGTRLNWLGIEAPQSAPVIARTAGGGTFLGQTYWFYVTYLNGKTGIESNPSPGVGVTFTANDQIVSIELPLSPDPQVTGRRVYITAAGGADGDVAYRLLTVDDNTTTSYSTNITAPVSTGASISATSGYFDHDVPPPTALVARLKDHIFAAGNQVYPTRVWFSAVGVPDYWLTGTAGDYEDMDSDSGEPATSLWGVQNRLLADYSDGRAGLWLTGDTTDPVDFDFLSRDHGCVGPLAACMVGPILYYMAERDIYRTDAYGDENVSSPDNQGLPSIQETLRSGVNPARRRYTVAAYYHKKEQIWFSCSSATATRNDQVVVFDRNQFKWSLYDIPLDNVIEYEDANGDPSLYGASNGFIVKLDTTGFDGLTTARGGTVGTGSTTTTVVTAASATVTNIARGMRILVYRKSNNTVYSGTVYSVTGSGPYTITVYTTLGYSPTSGDLWTVGGFGWFADVMDPFGTPMTKKRMRRVRIVATSDNSSNILRLTVGLNVIDRDWSPSNVAEYLIMWATSETFRIIGVGGLARSFRFRIGDTGFAFAGSDDPWPNTNGRLRIKQIEFEADELAVP
jgi:hypothetical protein